MEYEVNGSAQPHKEQKEPTASATITFLSALYPVYKNPFIPFTSNNKNQRIKAELLTNK
jgi:hypothetical protein